MASPTTTQPLSPPRSRLRGLSYLRNYTHSHLHPRMEQSDTNRPHSPSSVSPARPLEPSYDMAQEDGPNSHGAPTRSPAGGWLPHGGLNGTAQTPANPDTTCEYSTDSWPRHANPTSGGTDENRAQSGPSNTSAPRQATPSLRFLPSVEQSPRAHPPLVFNPIYRTLPNNDHVIRIGRYSERDNTADQNSAAAQKGGSVGFKSKVVSRRHCEMFQSGGQWFIKDVKSSSGTFLNHVRLSAPNFESRPFPVQDGDKVQLGIDFRGGEEMIFRCVKIRLEINRGWQRSLNNFK